MKVYFDNCCYNRPFDDQTQMRIFLEAQSKMFIQSLVVKQKIDIVWSYVSTFENEKNPYENKKLSIKKFSANAKEIIVENETVLHDANKFMTQKIKELDTLHLDCSKYANADYFITTDDFLLKYKTNELNIISPIDFVIKWEQGEINE